MESLSLGFPSPPPSLNHPKPHNFIPTCFLSLSPSLLNHSSPKPFHSFKSHSLFTNIFHLTPQTPTSTHSQTTSFSLSKFYSFLAAPLVFPLSSFAIEAPPLQIEENKINLEAIVVSIDDFNNKNPFFVAGVAFIWLVVIPLAEDYLSKYKFISAINAFRILRDDPSSQLIDIRDKRSLAVLNSPNLKFVSKSAVQVAYREGDEDGFLKEVLESIQNPPDTTICVLDNFDGASIKVAELLVKNGFKAAYAIRGGIRGKKGWQDIQESLLPPSVHIKPRKKVKSSKQVNTTGDMNKQSVNQDQSPSPVASENISNGYVHGSQPNLKDKNDRSSSSPYPNYPDLKPPSSPTPSKP